MSTVWSKNKSAFKDTVHKYKFRSKHDSAFQFPPNSLQFFYSKFILCYFLPEFALLVLDLSVDMSKISHTYDDTHEKNTICIKAWQRYVKGGGWNISNKSSSKWYQKLNDNFIE